MNISEITYQGSKKRFVKVLKTLIENNLEEGMIYVEPFAGGMNSFTPIEHSIKVANDINEYNIALWKAIKKYGIDALISEWKDYLDVLSSANSKDAVLLYNDMKQDCLSNGGKYPKALLGFVAYSCSFGGAWWNGFTKFNADKGENYVKEAIRSLIKQSKNAKSIENSDFTNTDYVNMDIPDNAFIYCDPPYSETKKYKDKFDNNKFWEWCRNVLNTHNNVKILVSEYTAPSDFICIWSSITQNKMGDNTMSKTEKLFIHESQKDDFNFSSLNTTPLSINDIREMVSRSINMVLENNENELMAFHGSDAQFDKFDLDFIGKGESSQYYGFGVYITGNEGTGQFYADLVASSKNSKKTSGRPDLKLYNLIRSISRNIKKTHHGVTFDEWKVLLSSQLKEKGCPQSLADTIGNMKSPEEWTKINAAIAQKAASYFDRYVYSVDIPDDNGNNYIDWNETDTQKLQFFISLFEKSGLNVNALNTASKKGIITHFGDIYALMFSGLVEGQRHAMNRPKNILNNMRDISGVLSSNGFIGIKVPIGNKHGGDNLGMNYVIFDTRNIKIIKRVNRKELEEN